MTFRRGRKIIRLTARRVFCGYNARRISPVTDVSRRLEPAYDAVLAARAFRGFSMSLRSAARSFFTALAASRSMRR